MKLRWPWRSKQAEDAGDGPATHGEMLTALVDGLKWVAADAEQQIEGLAAQGRSQQARENLAKAVADEIVLTHYENYLHAGELLQAGHINQAQLDKLTELDDLFTEMAERNERDLWAPEALQARQEWQVARKLAREILVHLGHGASVANGDYTPSKPIRIV